ncbi:hypothetical protein GPROT1_03557 [Gammaproteobacteria bacterium]|nr:hypothetical protein GPROT1_03557 [Gammaproteobacteria bacterium]
MTGAAFRRCATRVRMSACVLGLAWATLVVAVPARALDVVVPPLPASVAALAPDARLQGGGEMRFMGLRIYEGFYWAPARGYSLALPFALDLHYQRRLDGAKIAERSVEEIGKLGHGTPDQHARWGEAMRAIFPSVAQGDRLTGVNLPARGARFFHNGRPIGEIADPSFARAFFGIWLDPKTSRPDFRRRLLGDS